MISGASILLLAAAFLRHPYLQDLRSDRVSVLWTTPEPGPAAVEYSSGDGPWRSVTARTRAFDTSETGMAARFYQHQADLSGLAAGAEYLYRVSGDAREMRFRSAGPGPFTFLVFGDSGKGTPEQEEVARRMKAESPALVLHTGDLVYPSGTFEGYDTLYFAYYRELMQRAAFFPSLGNHDLADDGRAYLAVHALPAQGVPPEDAGRYYSFDWGNVHFVSLDTNTSLARAVEGQGRMLRWLEEDLARTRQFWRVAFFHQAPYAAGQHENDRVPALIREHVVPVLERHGVQVVFNADEHSYQRSHPLRGGLPAPDGDGTVYVTSGGGGTTLYAVAPRPFLAYQESAHHYLRCHVEGSRMVIRAIRIDGRQIDQVTLAPPPRLASSGVVNAASFTSEVAPGSLVSIFGENLASEEGRAGAWPLPVELAGTRVSLEGLPVPLVFVSRAQVNAQLPYLGPSQVNLRLITPNGVAETAVRLVEVAPAIFQTGAEPAVIHPGGQLVSRTAPARGGERLSIYSTGLGGVAGEIAAGQPAPRSPLLPVEAPVEVLLGSRRLPALFAGLAPGFAGLYQVDFQVPPDLAAATYELRIVAGGVSSVAAGLVVGMTIP